MRLRIVVLLLTACAESPPAIEEPSDGPRVLRASDESLGTSAAISDDGSTIALGADEHVYLFHDHDAWSLDVPGPRALAMSADGSELAVVARDAVFVLRDNERTVIPRVATSIALSNDGMRLAIAGTSASVLTRDGDEELSIAGGTNVALSGDGSLLAVSVDGAVQVFRRSADWAPVTRLSQASPGFGQYLAFSGNGAALAVGGNASVFVYDTSTWTGHWLDPVTFGYSGAVAMSVDASVLVASSYNGCGPIDSCGGPSYLHVFSQFDHSWRLRTREDANTIAERHSYSSPSKRSFAVSADGTTAVAADTAGHGIALVFDLEKLPTGIGEPCADACASGLACVEYSGIAGTAGPAMSTCEVRCKVTTDCPDGLSCIDLQDGPGRVCR